MKILITGASGLVGHNISDTLAVKGYDLLLPEHHQLNLIDYSTVLNFLERNHPDMIIHCAGRVGGIQANIKEPVRFLVDNIDMGRNVIMAAYKTGVPRLLNFGSSCMYPRNAPNPLKEEMILQGELEPTNEGYAIAKIMAQRLCSYIVKENPALRYKTLMPCNLYGKYDKFDLANAHMIPSAINKIHAAKQENSDVLIWGTGNVRREFMYAGELAECVGYCIEEFDRMPEVLNVGIGSDYTINEYYEAVAEVIGYKGKFIHDEAKPEGMKQKLVDVTKLNAFGWKSSISLHEGIERTYNYFLETIRSGE